MYHMFDVDVAKEVGIIAAILFQNIAYWCQHSYANGTNFHEGRYWTYNSIKAFRDIFPYLSKSQVDTALKKLIDTGLIVKGNFNKSTYDRTAWYALTENGNALFKNQKSISEKSEMEVREIGNGFLTNRKPIPDINTNTVTTNINTDSGFTPPTVEELKAYASGIGFDGFDAEYFIEYYKANNWKKNNGKPVVSWKQCVQTWKKTESKNEGRSMAKTNRPNPAHNYEQREYKDEDYGDDFFINLDEYGEG